MGNRPSPSPSRNLGILTFLVLAQFMGTSLWFAGNAAAPELESLLGETGLVPWITSAVQLGFILGTFGYAFFQVADRFSPSKVFLWSAVAAALANLSLLFLPMQFEVLLGGRFLTGVFLGGIYPVGMKIAADYVEDGLGMALGFLVGALVLGTSFPFLLQALDWNLSYPLLFAVPSGLAILAGVLVGFGIPDGPFRKKSAGLNLRLIPRLAFPYLCDSIHLDLFCDCGGRHLLCIGWANLQESWECPRGDGEFGGFGRLWIAPAAASRNPLGGSTSLSTALGDARYRRFPAILHLGCPERLARGPRHCPNYRKWIGFWPDHCQHSSHPICRRLPFS